MMFTALYVAGQDMGAAFSAERLSLAGQMTLIGMGMIFSVLALLWAVLAIFKVVFAKPEKKKKPEAPVAQPAPVVEETVAIAAETNDDELIAVITAAVAAYMAQENPDVAPSGFRVVSFRRANGGRSWNSNK